MSVVRQSLCCLLLVSLLCSPSDPGTVQLSRELDVVCHVNDLLQCGWLSVACCSVSVALSSLGSRSLESDTVQIKLQG
jgi:hypothetical protein